MKALICTAESKEHFKTPGQGLTHVQNKLRASTGSVTIPQRVADTFFFFFLTVVFLIIILKWLIFFLFFYFSQPKAFQRWLEVFGRTFPQGNTTLLNRRGSISLIKTAADRNTADT